MPLVDYLTADRVVLLASEQRKEAINELAEMAMAGLPQSETRHVVAAVESREKEISTCIAPGIAIPHARLDGLPQTMLMVGVSHEGVTWVEGSPLVHLVVMLLSGAAAGDKHMHILAEIAKVLRQDDVLDQVKIARTPHEVYDVLSGAQRGRRLPPDERADTMNRTVLSSAFELARQTKAASVIVFANDRLDLSFLQSATPPLSVFLASSHLRKHREYMQYVDGSFEVPFAGQSSEHLFEFALLLAMSEGLIESGDLVVCAWGRRDTGHLDSVSLVDISQSFGLLLSLRSELSAGDVQHHVLNRVLNIASGLAREGREGKPVGTLLVLGQYERVISHCRQMLVNPFKGYDEDQCNILDPSLEETIKEFSAIDGAFILRGDGTVMSAGTHLSVPTRDLELQPGLGSRHTAAAGITASTGALAITISESTGTVRLYAQCKAIMVLPRNGG